MSSHLCGNRFNLVAEKYSVVTLFCQGFNPPPKPRELRLCRLPSSIVYLSTINEDSEYRVLQPSGSWDSFVISIVILVSIGMLVLFSTALGANISPPFLRSSVREVFQSAAASVLSMLSPVVPQADGPGASSEQSAVDPADSVQATSVLCSLFFVLT